MVKIAQKGICLATLLIFIFSSICFSNTARSMAWEKMDKENYAGIVSELSEKSEKTAEEYYLLGKAYHKLGKNTLAFENWKKCNLMVQKLPLEPEEKYQFIFPPNKVLSKKEKTQIYSEFQTQFNGLLQKAKEKLVEKQEKQIAKADKLREKADTISGRQSMLPKKEWKSTHEFPVKTFFIVLFGLLGFAVVGYGCWYVLIAMPKRRREKEEHERQLALEKEKTAQKAFEYDPKDAEINEALGEGKPKNLNHSFAPPEPFIFRQKPVAVRDTAIRVKIYNVPRNDNYYEGGPFLYHGQLFASEAVFYNRMGWHYTNALYLENLEFHHSPCFDPYSGHEIIGNVREFDHAARKAAHLEAMADEFEQQAEETQREIDKLEAMEMPEATSNDFEDDEMSTEEKDSGEEEVKKMPELEGDDFKDDEMPAKETDSDKEIEEVNEMPEPESNDFESNTSSGGSDEEF